MPFPKSLKASAHLLDFNSTSPPLPCYNGTYAKILDNVFTPSECAELIALAEAYGAEHNGVAGGWEPARLNGPPGSGEGVLYSNFRRSERILVFDDAAADRIFAKLRPLVESEIGIIDPTGKWGAITGKTGRKQGDVWKLKRVNPRLSFLRYGPGHFFKKHCDGLVSLPVVGPEEEKSFVTLHIYLNEGSEGGATRFWDASPGARKDSKDMGAAYIDVEPKLGRVLVFQQRMLVHSGEEVRDGVKYTMRSDFMFEKVGTKTK